MKVCDDELRGAIEELLELAGEVDNVNPESLVDELHKQVEIVEALL